MIKRSTLLSAAVFALALSPLSAMATETLKISSHVPPNHAFAHFMNEWSARLSELSGGELQFEMYPASQLGGPNRQFDLAATGISDISFVLHAAAPGRFPMAEIAGLPLAYPGGNQSSAVSSRRMTELAPEYMADENEGTVILWMAVTPPLKIAIRGHEVREIEDFAGLRIRYAGKTFQQVVEALDASPMPVRSPETADAISKGVIDGATFPYEAFQAFDIGPIVDYAIEPGFASATFGVVMNANRFNSLSPELQQLILDQSGPDAAEAFGAAWDAGELNGRAYMLENDVEIVTLDDVEYAKLQDLASPIITSMIEAAEANGLPAQAFYDAYTAE